MNTKSKYERKEKEGIIMEILEFGNRQNKTILLIHGFQSPYQIWDEYIEYYKNDYHVVVPILDGHNPKVKDDFISFEDSAEKIENFCINNFGNEIYALYGMSMGGVLGAYLWQNKRLKIKNVILESSPLVSYNKFMTNILARQYMMLTHKTKQRVEKIVNQATNSIIPEKKLPEFLEVMDNITDTTISNYINAIGKYKLPADIEMQGTKLFYFHGTKMNEMLAQKTAKYIKRNYPKSGIICFQGKGHCEDSLMHPEVMIAELDKILPMNS